MIAIGYRELSHHLSERRSDTDNEKIGVEEQGQLYGRTNMLQTDEDECVSNSSDALHLSMSKIDQLLARAKC
jgi:hypothetical protein